MFQLVEMKTKVRIKPENFGKGLDEAIPEELNETMCDKVNIYQLKYEVI